MKKSTTQVFGEMLVLSLLMVVAMTIPGCTPSQLDLAKTFLKSQPNGGCYCNNNCSTTSCNDVPGATATYQGVTYDVGCYCSCTSVGGGSCAWNDEKWNKRTKANGIEIDPEF
jgi:hypothetical protein